MELFDSVDLIYIGLNSNIFKCETVGIVTLKEFHLTAYGLILVDLISDTPIKIGVQFSYNKKTESEKTSTK